MNRRSRALLTLSLVAAGCAPAVPAAQVECPKVAATSAPVAAPASAPSVEPDASAARAPALEAPKTFDLAAIDDYVGRYVKERGFVGLSLAVVRDGKVVLAKGYGKSAIATGADVTADTAFAIGSVTKQFACASLLLLAEDGKLSIDDRVAKYYPDLTRAKDITLYDLVTHQSGYRDYYPLDFVGREMESPIEHDALIKSYEGRALDFEPRTRFSYSNTGYIIAGRVVEKVSGEPFERFLSRRILKPLGMDHSIFEPKAGASGIATGYTSFAGGEREVAPLEAKGWLYTAGGLYATATDLAKWNLALIDGKVLKPKSYELFAAPRRLADGTPLSYACGVAVSERGSEKVMQHTGAVSGFRAYNTMVPRTRSAVIVLANAEDIEVSPLHQSLVALLLKDHRAPTAGVPKIDGPAPKEVALAMIRQMQSGTLDRTRLGEDFSRYMAEAKVKAAAPQLAALGAPTRVDVEDVGERGGMEVAVIQITFKTTSRKAYLYRTSDGKIQQFLLYGR